MMVTFSLYETWTSGCSDLAPSLAKWSASSLPVIPQSAGIHCTSKVTLHVAMRSFIALARSGDLLFARASKTERASVRKTTDKDSFGRVYNQGDCFYECFSLCFVVAAVLSGGHMVCFSTT